MQKGKPRKAGLSEEIVFRTAPGKLENNGEGWRDDEINSCHLPDEKGDLQPLSAPRWMCI